ncbi:Uncharacterised protein [Mycobacterium tuberculosis]|nr:Uncharacterised protein [Mycobacterium tuberculosis]
MTRRTAWIHSSLKARVIPIPVPFSFVVKNGVPNKLSFSGGMPTPLSWIQTITSSSVDQCSIWMEPFPGIASKAFFSIQFNFFF